MLRTAPLQISCHLADLLQVLHRKLGLARQLMDMLEDVTEKVHDGFFVDLFVRVSNKAAIQMYNKVLET